MKKSLLREKTRLGEGEFGPRLEQHNLYGRSFCLRIYCHPTFLVNFGVALRNKGRADAATQINNSIPIAVLQKLRGFIKNVEKHPERITKGIKTIHYKAQLPLLKNLERRITNMTTTIGIEKRNRIRRKINRALPPLPSSDKEIEEGSSLSEEEPTSATLLKKSPRLNGNMVDERNQLLTNRLETDDKYYSFSEEESTPEASDYESASKQPSTTPKVLPRPPLIKQRLPQRLLRSDQSHQLAANMNKLVVEELKETIAKRVEEHRNSDRNDDNEKYPSEVSDEEAATNRAPTPPKVPPKRRVQTRDLNPTGVKKVNPTTTKRQENDSEDSNSDEKDQTEISETATKQAPRTSKLPSKFSMMNRLLTRHLSKKKGYAKSKYFLNMNRKEAETALKQCSNDGIYMFRASNRYYCTLSVVHAKQVYHIGVKSTARDLRLRTQGAELHFQSLKEIVKYLKEYPVQKIADTGDLIEFTHHYRFLDVQ
ncbi:hypothetical protein Trydic_g20947 [Trypoxylus dichotomus]